MSEEPMYKNPELLVQKQMMEKIGGTLTDLRRAIGNNCVRLDEEHFKLDTLCKVSDVYGGVPILFDSNIEQYSGLDQAIEYVGDVLSMDADSKTPLRHIERQAWKQYKSIDYLAGESPTFEEPPVPRDFMWLENAAILPGCGYVVGCGNGFRNMSKGEAQIYKAYLRGERDFS